MVKEQLKFISDNDIVCSVSVFQLHIMRLDNTYNGGELTCQVAWLLDSFSINLI